MGPISPQVNFLANGLVFRGKLIITGDNYESGVAARLTSLPGFGQEVHINIFNISKINSEVRGGRAPRIKLLSEYCQAPIRRALR